MIRVVLAAVAAIGLGSVPVSVVLACSCMMPGTPEEVVAASDLAFLGTVVDTAPAPPDPNGFGSTVRYAFQVERVSAEVEGDIVEVRALGGDGGASCGFEFGEGERWFVAAHRAEGGLETTLCSGNMLIEGMPDAEVERLADALPIRPTAAPASPPDGFLPPVAVLGAGAALLALVAVAFLAFRRGDRSC